MDAEMIEKLAADKDLIEIARAAIEDELISFRDDRLSQIRGNGLVCRERDGVQSSVIRFGPEHALVVGLSAIARHIKEQRHGR